jgi:hypothetical protein
MLRHPELTECSRNGGPPGLAGSPIVFLHIGPAYLLLLVMLLSSGCTHSPAPTQPAPALVTTLQVTHAVSLRVCPFQLTVTDLAHNPVPATGVALSLTMTTMLMPPNSVRMTQKSPGLYVGSGTFTMSGPWVVSADGEINGKRTTFASFPVNVKD